MCEQVIGPRYGLVLALISVFMVDVSTAMAAKSKGPIAKFGLGGSFRMTVDDTEKCIATAGGAKMGRQFHAWRCRKSSQQMFVMKLMQKGWYQVRSKTGGMCLDVSGSAKKNGAPVVQWRCKAKGNANQLWKILPGKGSGRFMLKAKHSGKCLNLDHADERVSTFVQRPCQRKSEAQNLRVAK